MNKYIRTVDGKPTKEYRAWSSMKARCYCKSSTKDRGNNYQEKGIIVCQRWLDSFENFFDDMGCAPSKKHSLDRIDNEGNYEPSNCRWATSKEQALNTGRSLEKYTYNGETLYLKEWAEKFNIEYYTLLYRVRHMKLELKDALEFTTLTEINGVKKSIKEWCKEFGFKHNLILDYKSLHPEMSYEEVFKTYKPRKIGPKNKVYRMVNN